MEWPLERHSGPLLDSSLTRGQNRRVENDRSGLGVVVPVLNWLVGYFQAAQGAHINGTFHHLDQIGRGIDCLANVSTANS